VRFFNLDLHIGVIGDIKQIFNELGHEVTSWSISGHRWLLEEKPRDVDVVNQRTWRNINRGMCDAFYARYRSELEKYDAFIVTHTPCFSMLYEQWNKPIICVASTRYEAPFSDNREAWEGFNDFLRRKIDDRLIIPVANNKYDAAYAEYFTQRVWQVIPSLCDYTNSPYSGNLQKSLYCSKFKYPGTIHGLVSKEEYFKQGILVRAARRLGIPAGKRGYSWQDLASFRSAVHVPYNASTMSIFEMYASGIPMLFPSLQFTAKLYAEFKHQGVFSELSYSQVRNLPSKSAIPCDSRDPNDYENDRTMMDWIAISDFYDSENLKHLVYFDSFEEVEHLLKIIDVGEIHRKMVEHHKTRSARTYLAWKAILTSLSNQLVEKK
jgi:hypothetical protein